MLKTRLTELLGIKYPIFQAGMGPFPVTNLCIAAANAGCLGLMSTAGPRSRLTKPEVFKVFCESASADIKDDDVTIFKKMMTKAFEQTKVSQGIFGVNVMVSNEVLENANNLMTALIELRKENPEMQKRLKVLFTAAGDPMPWGKVAKDNDLIWAHVTPSVKAAKRCKKAGVQVIVASGHEGGFHTSWEPVHSMILLPAVVEEVADDKTLVVGCGGFCDGKTLAASLMLGADGAQMGTRFLATQESDFTPLWKQMVIEAEDRGTLVARGYVGPARWIKNERSIQHAKNTLKVAPGVFTGVIEDDADLSAAAGKALLDFEDESINAVLKGDRSKAMAAAGESAQRINDMPKTADVVQKIVKEAEELLKAVPRKVLV